MYSGRLLWGGRFVVAALACVLFTVNSATAQDDCNRNGLSDAEDILANPNIDCNDNGIPDDCEIPIGGMDSCLDAFDACPAVEFYYVGTLEGMSLDGSSSCDNGEVDADVWYAYTTPGEGNTSNLTVSINDLSFTGFILSAHTACPGTSENEIACSNEAYRSVCEGFYNELTFDVEPGQTYYIRIASRIGDEAQYTMDLWGPDCDSGALYPNAMGQLVDRNMNGRLDVCEADCNTNSVPDFEEIQPGREDVCGNAMPICAFRPYTGTTVGATDSSADLGEDTRPDVWYSYTPITDGNVDICLRDAYLTNSTGTQQALLDSSIELSVYDGCPSVVEGPIDVSAYCVGLEATAGETYFFRIAVDESYTAAYEFMLYGPECKAPGGRLPTNDCNGNGVPDDCDLAGGTSLDCNQNGVPDECDLSDELVSTGTQCSMLDKMSVDARVYQLNPANGETAALATGEPNYSYAYGAITIEPSSGDFITVDMPMMSLLRPIADSLSPQSMYRVNRATGEITTLTNPVGDAVILGMTFAQDGTLYGSVVFQVGQGEELDGPSMIVSGIAKLDPVNGGIVEMLDTNSLCLGMGTSPDGTLYAVGLGMPSEEEPNPETELLESFFEILLYTIDPVTGAVLTQVPLSVPTEADPFRFVHAIAFGHDGTLYGLSFSGLCEYGYYIDALLPPSYSKTDIVSIDLATGLVTKIAESDRYLFGLGGPIVEYSKDCNDNGIPDECEADCNSNGIADECDIADGTSTDCNGNGIPDECDAALALGACPDNFSLQAADETGIIVTYTIPEATGGCNPLVTVAPESGSLFPIGTTTVTVTATDDLGATLACSFTVEVLPPDAPGPQPTPGTPQFCLPFLFQTTCGIPLCAGPCFFGGLLSSIVGIFGLRVLVRRRYKRRR